MTTRVINLGPVRLGGRQPLALIAGPCVIESRAGCLALAARLARLAAAEQAAESPTAAPPPVPRDETP